MIKTYRYKNIENEAIDFDGKPVVIWGISSSGVSVYQRLIEKKANIVAFTDSYVEAYEEDFIGIPIIDSKKLIDMPKGTIVYISTKNKRFQAQILNILQRYDNIEPVSYGTVWGPGEYNVYEMKEKQTKDKKEIKLVYENLEDDKSKNTFNNLIEYRTTNNPELIYEIYEQSHPQYFPNTFFKPKDKEIFIDAGAYNGDTTLDFIKWTNGNYIKIYAMEPDGFMFDAMCFLLKRKKLDNIICLNKGAYSTHTTLKFENISSSGSSTISEYGSSSIQTISIDELLDGEAVTYIKMDIEGAEMEALYGCMKSITKYRPKLAISVYHKDDDLWKIPAYIMTEYPDYKFYMRHYTDITTETILYAEKV